MREELKVMLAEKAEQVAISAEIIMAQTRDWQMVKEYMCNRLEEEYLTETQKEKMKRYQFIYNQLVSGKYTDSDIVSMSAKIFDTKKTQSYEDLAATRELFNSVINVNKAFELHLALEITKNYMRKCEEMSDLKQLQKFNKDKIEIIKQLQDIEDNRGELFEGHVFEMTFDPTLLGAPEITKENMTALLKSINEKRDKKINLSIIEDLEFKDIPNGSEETSSE